MHGLSCWASLVAWLVKNLPAMWKTWVRSLGWDHPLEKRKANHSRFLTWRIPWSVQSMGSQKSDTAERLWLSLWTLQLQHVGSREHGLSSCPTQIYLPWGMWDLSSPPRDWTCAPCFGRQILNHWTTREVLNRVFNRIMLVCISPNKIFLCLYLVPLK